MPIMNSIEVYFLGLTEEELYFNRENYATS